MNTQSNLVKRRWEQVLVVQTQTLGAIVTINCVSFWASFLHLDHKTNNHSPIYSKFIFKGELKQKWDNMGKNTLKHFVKHCTSICCCTGQKYDLVLEQSKSSGRRNCQSTETWERKERRKLWWPLIFQKVPELESCEQRCLSSCQLEGPVKIPGYSLKYFVNKAAWKKLDSSFLLMGERGNLLRISHWEVLKNT